MEGFEGMRDKFTFFGSYAEALSNLPDNERLKCYDALIQYAIYDTEPDLEGVTKAIFSLMKPNVDNSIKRCENGKNGGRPSADDNQTETKPKPNLNQTETKAEPNNNQTETKPKPNKEKEKDKDRDREKKTDKDLNTIPPKSPQGERDWNKHTNLDNAEHILNNGYEKADYIQRHEALKDCIREWMQYKDAKKPRSSNHYANERSITALLNKFVENSEKYGERAVIDVVNDSLAAGYQGIIWDKVKAYNARSGTTGKIDWSMV